MSIRHAILGLLSWKPLSGYDLKKLIADSGVFYWSGNNNQIYRALLDLAGEGLVQPEVLITAALPAKKVYTLTAEGRSALAAWVRSAPEALEMRHAFLIQLAWADLLTGRELDDLLAAHEREAAAALAMQEEHARRRPHAPDRTERERYLWRQIDANALAHWRAELEWVRGVRAGLSELEQAETRSWGD